MRLATLLLPHLIGARDEASRRQGSACQSQHDAILSDSCHSGASRADHLSDLTLDCIAIENRNVIQQR